MSFEAVVLGVGDTFSACHVTSALLLSCRGFHLALDCPDRYRGVLAAASARAGRTLSLRGIDHVLITHVHGDHMNGLEGVAFHKHFREGKRLGLLAAPEVRAQMWEGRLAAPMGRLWDGRAFRDFRFDDWFAHTPLDWERPVTVGPFRIRARPTRHHVPTSALLIEADGHTLGYSADTAFDPSLIGFLAEADVIVHETNLGPAHTPYADLAALPLELRGKMRLIHYPDGFDAEASNVPVLREGDVLPVAPGAGDPRVLARPRPGPLARLRAAWRQLTA